MPNADAWSLTGAGNYEPAYWRKTTLRMDYFSLFMDIVDLPADYNRINLAAILVTANRFELAQWLGDARQIEAI
jgi:hypothetical protein